MNSICRPAAIFFLILLLPAIGHGAVRYAASTAVGSKDCSSWANACTLQTALSAATLNSEIWVKAGTYKPSVPAGRGATFQLLNTLSIYGGFAGDENLRSQRNWTANVTILSGDIGIQGDPSDNVYSVVSGTGAVSGITLDGFTITGGNADGFTDSDGGGLYFYSSGTLTVANCIFSNNAATDGGGIYNAGGSLTVTNCTFSNNTAASYGGGMFNNLTSATLLTNCIFSGNSAGTSGGGISNSNGASPAVTSCTFDGNSAIYGGGMANINNSSNPLVTGCTFSNNIATYGGGMRNGATTAPVVINSTFSGNSASMSGGGMHNSYANPTVTNSTFSGNNPGGMYNSYASPTIANSIFWGDSGGEITTVGAVATVTNSVVQGGYSGSGNIATDPLLAPLGDYGGATRTMALLPGSSAINAGNAASCPATDQRGMARPQGGACDIGAFEFRGFGLTLAITGPGTVTSQSQNGVTYACVKGAGGICDPVTFSEGDTVTLTATGSNSTFSGWSGADYIGDPSANPGSILMNGNKSVTATFTANPALVQIQGNTTIYYTLISALANCGGDAVILARDTAFGGGLTVSSHTITLKGGFPDANFTAGSQSGYTTISGPLTVTGGKLIAERVRVGL